MPRLQAASAIKPTVKKGHLKALSIFFLSIHTTRFTTLVRALFGCLSPPELLPEGIP